MHLGIKKGDRGIQNTVIKLCAVTSAPTERVKELAARALTVSPMVNSLKSEVELFWHEKINLYDLG